MSKFKILTNDTFSLDELLVIQKIEARSYPPEMCMFQNIDMDDIEDLIEDNIYTVLMWEGGYMIYSTEEIVDLCGKNFTLGLMAEIGQMLKGRTFTADLRPGTSLPLLRALSKWGKIHMEEHEVWEWCGEDMVSVTISFP